MLTALAAAAALALQPGTHVIGSSALGRPIRATYLEATGTATERILVFGCIHGDEDAGVAVTRRLRRAGRLDTADLVIVDSINPDGQALGTRLNGRGVDLNRNFPSQWRHNGVPGDPEYSGPRPLSEPESRLARRLILAFRPTVTIWLHQPQAIVRAYGQSEPAARRYARLAGMRYRRIRWPRGTAPNWQNHRFPGTASFVVEFPAGRLSAVTIRRNARAIRLLTAAG